MKKRLIVCGCLGLCMSAAQLLAAAQNDGAGEVPASQPAGKPAVQSGPAAAAPARQFITGKVVEVLSSGGYTYLSLEREGKKKWVAIPAAPVKVGQEVRVRPGTEMGLFSSKSLNRTFDDILFSAGLADSPEQAPTASERTPVMPGHAAGAPAMPQGMAAMLGAGGGGERTEPLTGKVAESMDSGGYTYISLDSGAGKLWVAVPTMKVTVGQKVELQPGAVMTNFTSKSLNRTFERVIFSAGPVRK